LKPIIPQIMKELYCRFQDDEVPALGAQLTFYIILSFFPFLIFLFTILSYTPINSDAFLLDLSHLLPREAYLIVHKTIKEILKVRNTTLLSFGMITTLWSASNGVNSIIRGLNKAYDEEETRSFLVLRGISLFFTIALTTSIAFSLSFLVFGEILGFYLFSIIGISPWFGISWSIFRYFIMIITILIVFIFLYKHMPNRQLTFKEVLPGTIFSTFFWILLSILFSKYINHFGKFNIMYGSIGGIIILLLWMYISSIVILLGGELNAVLLFLKEGKSKPRCKNFGGLPFFTSSKP